MRTRIPIARITADGLAVMAISVALLWGCLAIEHVTLRRAVAERARVLRQMEVLRLEQRSRPVALPTPVLPLPHRATVG